MENVGELKKDLLGKKYGTSGDDANQFGVPVWGRQWSRQLCLCNEMNFLVHYIFILYFVCLFINSLVYDEVAYTLTFNSICFLLHLIFIVAMAFGRITLTRCIGGTVSEVLLWPFGVFTTSDLGDAKKTQMCVYFGELIFIIPFSCFMWIMWSEVDQCEYRFLGLDEDWDQCFGYNLGSFTFHLLIFLVVFNTLIPVHPLHGSYALVATLEKIMSVENIARVCLLFSIGWLIFFIVCSIVYKNLMCSLASMFILWQTWSLIQYYRYEFLRSHPLFENIKVRDSEKKVKGITNKIKNTLENASKGKYEPIDVNADDVKEVLDNTGLLTEHRNQIGAVFEAGRAYEFDSEQNKQMFESWLGQGATEVVQDAIEEEPQSQDDILNKQLKNAVLTIEDHKNDDEEKYVSFNNAYDEV